MAGEDYIELVVFKWQAVAKIGEGNFMEGAGGLVAHDIFTIVVESGNDADKAEVGESVKTLVENMSGNADAISEFARAICFPAVPKTPADKGKGSKSNRLSGVDTDVVPS